MNPDGRPYRVGDTVSRRVDQHERESGLLIPVRGSVIDIDTTPGNGHQQCRVRFAGGALEYFPSAALEPAPFQPVVIAGNQFQHPEAIEQHAIRQSGRLLTFARGHLTAAPTQFIDNLRAESLGLVTALARWSQFPPDRLWQRVEAAGSAVATSHETRQLMHNIWADNAKLGHDAIIPSQAEDHLIDAIRRGDHNDDVSKILGGETREGVLARALCEWYQVDLNTLVGLLEACAAVTPGRSKMLSAAASDFPSSGQSVAPPRPGGRFGREQLRSSHKPSGSATSARRGR